MAKIGLTNFRYATLTEAEDGTPSYGTVYTPAKAVSCSVSMSNNSAMLYADDSLAESDTSFNSASVSMELDKEDPQTMANLLGHAYDESTNALVRNTNDSAPYVGLGRIVTKMINGVYKYTVEFLYKVKFSEPNQEDTTKGESVSFSTIKIEGSASALQNGDWSKSETFDTKSDAVAALLKLFGASATSSPAATGTSGTSGKGTGSTSSGS